MKTLTFASRPAHFLLVVLVVIGLLVISLLMPIYAQAPHVGDAAAQAARNASPTAPANRNVYSTGGNVHSTVIVDGDFIAAGGRVLVDQQVKGDASLAGGSVDVRAPIGDDVRAAGGNVNIDSAIGGELYAVGGNLTLTKNAQVANAATLYGGSVTIDGRLDGPLKVGAQKIVLNGEVNNDARLVAEQIELGPTAKISGALSYTANEFKKSDSAVISGAITREERAVERSTNNNGRDWQMNMGRRGPTWLGSVFTFLALLACATVFLLVFPVFSTQASSQLKASPGLAIGVGLGSVLAVPLLAILLFITLLGIPLGVAVLALFPVLLLAGYVVGVQFVAERARLAIRKEASTSFAMNMGFFALALLLVMLLGRLPFVGSLFIFIITIMGVGACVLELYMRRYPSSGSAPPSRATDSNLVAI
jgi:cytoskeletal protein CcmA (bactofilin family)